MAIVSLALLLAGALTGVLWFVGRSLPVLPADVVSGVTAPVTVHRDGYGVPHIQGYVPADVFFVQGYLHAQDRLFLMDLARRAASGRLAAILGRGYLNSDKLALAIGLLRAAHRAWPGLTPDHRAALEAYAAGVNAFIQDHAGRLPLEFTLLGYSPDPWRAIDSLAVASYLVWSLDHGFLTEILFWELALHLGPARAATLFPPGAEETAAAAARLEALPALAGSLAGLRAAVEQAPLGGSASFAGSAAWALGGGLTATGRPLLATALHLPLTAPSALYQNHLTVEGGFAVTGVSYPGMPGVISGHNRHIAWGLAFSGGDGQDLYLERQHPADPARFEYEGEWYRAEVERHVIEVRDEPAPVAFTVYLTRHGPLIGEATGLGVPVSLRWTGHQGGSWLAAVLDLVLAGNEDEFRRALEGAAAPAYVYADRRGNIGYHSGLQPIRGAGDGRLPAPGWTGEYEWAGLGTTWLPNPAEGYVVVAPSHRVRTLTAAVEGRRDLTLEDLIPIQNSRANPQARLLGPIFLGELTGLELVGVEAQALDLLAGWLEDPRDDPDAAGAALYHALYLGLLEASFRHRLGDDLFQAFLRYGHAVESFDRMLREGQPEWVADRTGLVRAAFSAAVAGLEAALGRDPTRWEWGQLDTVTFEHPLGGGRPLHLVFNRGPHPGGLGGLTPGDAAAPWRYLVDLADGRGLDVMAIGVSGHPFSVHYDDQLVLWLKGGYRPLPVGSEAASATTVFRPRR